MKIYEFTEIETELAEEVTVEDTQDFHEEFGYLGYADMFEAEYQGRKVKLNKPMQGDVKKFKVYVKNPKGNVVKVNFGDPNMRIKKSNPARRRSFRARHNCDNPGPKHKARYWSCRKWQMKLTDINEWVCGKCNCEPCRCDSVVEKWSSKYKKSIDCSNPKGFSQKAHCAGKKKTNEFKIVKPDSVNTKGMKRVEMPQIHKNDYNEFIDYLKDNGAEFTKQTMPAKQLKATQGEFSDAGVMKQIDKHLRGEPRKPVIASQDNYIIDGHHRWLVAWNTGDTVDVFKVNIDADELLKLVKKFPKTTYKDIYTEELYDFDKDTPMKSTVAVPGYGTMSVDGLMQNLVQSVTELLGKMKQGTDGMRFADYELNSNKVLTTKLSALIKALDDLQAIRKKGGSNSRNIQKEQEEEQLPIDTNGIFSYIQQLESRQNIRPEDADLMRRGIQSLESARQTINPQAILQLLTMLT